MVGIKKTDNSTQSDEHKPSNIFNKTDKSEKEKTLWLSVIVISLIIFLIWVVKVIYNIKNL